MTGRPAFVVADAHGNLDAVAGLLRQAGILDDEWERVDRETRVVQLGDLCNCVASSAADDRRCLDHVDAWIDDYLVGNHEYPYFGGPAFAGFSYDPLVADSLRRLGEAGTVKACVAVDGILVSHAGLPPRGEWDRARPPWAELFADETNLLWGTDPLDRRFSAIGRSRGGPDPAGGMLWADWSEPKGRDYPQVVGHTIGDAARWYSSDGWYAVCIDLGAKRPGSRIAGAWIRDGRVEVVVYQPPEAT